MDPSQPLIRLEGVERTYRQGSLSYPALRHIDLAILPGEHIAIVGKSGSGKSTLLNMLTGIDHPTSGTVTIDSQPIHRLNESELAAWRGRTIGIVFQFFQLIPTLTVLENLLLAMDFVGAIPKGQRTTRALGLLDQTGIAAQAHKFPSQLSGGEQQRAAIARALANDPPIIVADEPTGNLDSKTTDAVLALFAGLVEAGKTVVVVTHERTLGVEYDRVITLKDGALV